VGARFWGHLDALLDASEIVIDRPAGSTHPRFPEFVYPLDYGYLGGTVGGDGQGIDVWVGSRGDRALVGVLATVDLEKRDAELKLLLGCTDAETEALLAVHDDGRQAATFVPRPDGGHARMEGPPTGPTR